VTWQVLSQLIVKICQISLQHSKKHAKSGPKLSLLLILLMRKQSITLINPKSTLITYYEKLTKKKQENFLKNHYLYLPKTKIDGKKKVLSFSNKTFVFNEGKIIARYKKTILSFADFRFINQNREVQYFNCGRIVKHLLLQSVPIRTIEFWKCFRKNKPFYLCFSIWYCFFSRRTTT